MLYLHNCYIYLMHASLFVVGLLRATMNSRGILEIGVSRLIMTLKVSMISVLETLWAN